MISTANPLFRSFPTFRAGEPPSAKKTNALNGAMREIYARRGTALSADADESPRAAAEKRRPWQIRVSIDAEAKTFKTTVANRALGSFNANVQSLFPGTAGIYLAEKLTTEGNAIIREFSEGGGAIVCALIVGSPAWFSGAETKPAQLTYKQAIFAKKSDYPSTSVEMPVENQDKYLSLWDAGALWWIYHTYVAYWDDYSAKFVQKKIDELNENSKTVYELVRYPIGSVACDDEGHISIIQTMRSPIYFFKCG